MRQLVLEYGDNGLVDFDQFLELVADYEAVKVSSGVSTAAPLLKPHAICVANCGPALIANLGMPRLTGLVSSARCAQEDQLAIASTAYENLSRKIGFGEGMPREALKSLLQARDGCSRAAEAELRRRIISRRAFVGVCVCVHS